MQPRRVRESSISRKQLTAQDLGERDIGGSHMVAGIGRASTVDRRTPALHYM
jgi:hypothetical protein